MTTGDVEWRDVVGYEGIYQVSSHGDVRSVDREIFSAQGARYRRPGCLLKLNLHKGRPLVHLSAPGRKLCTKGVHILVLEAFVGRRPTGLMCCHNDGNPQNNHLSNLRWDTHKSNMQDALVHGTNFQSNKTHCPRGHEYTPENIYRNPSYPTGRTCRTCAREYNVARWQRSKRKGALR